MSQKALILASGSPRRKLLLEDAGVDFDTIPANVEEWESPMADPRELVRHNAALKAAHVAAHHPGRVVLAADTTVALDDHVLNKPLDRDEAKVMLRRLSGRTHRVYTAVALRRDDDEHSTVTESGVTFRELDDEAIAEYFAIVNPLDKAGAYGIQEGREIIIESFEGSFTNIMGLPMETLEKMFEQFGLNEVLRYRNWPTTL